MFRLHSIRLLLFVCMALGVQGVMAAEPPAKELREPPITAQDRSHWAYLARSVPTIPTVAARDWIRTPIDAFVLSRLEKSHLTPGPAADRTTLLRRVTFDLTGLPPTPAEVAEFLADRSPRAFERVVE